MEHIAFKCMEPTEKDQIIREIERVENQLRNLRLQLQRDSNTAEGNEEPLRVGEEVEITNPRGSQADRGILTKIHKRTKRGTVTTKTRQNQEEKVVRLLTNLKRATPNEYRNQRH